MAASEKQSEVILLDTWASMFGMRARIALAEKGIEYEYREEDLANKSPLLLETNPVHRKIPVLIHRGRPICESLVIVQYIDEFWSDLRPALLPRDDPYERARARFWADYIDKKLYDTGRRVWASPEEERGKAKDELVEVLRVLEGELGDRPFFAGEEMGFVDIALVGFYSWFPVYEKYGKFSVEAECPRIVAWAKRCLQRKSVSDTLPDGDRVIEFIAGLRKRFGMD